MESVQSSEKAPVPVVRPETELTREKVVNLILEKEQALDQGLEKAREGGKGKGESATVRVKRVRKASQVTNRAPNPVKEKRCK